MDTTTKGNEMTKITYTKRGFVHLIFEIANCFGLKYRGEFQGYFDTREEAQQHLDMLLRRDSNI